MTTGYIPQEEGEDSAPLMILEYMPFGDLLDFLSTHRYVVTYTMDGVQVLSQLTLLS